MITWADLRMGDLVRARTGAPWRVDRWEDAPPRTRWIATGGGGRERLFTLSPLDGSREPITAPHNLSDPVDRVFQYDRSDLHDALTALGAAFQFDTISEGEAPPMTQTAAPHPAGALGEQPCRHPDEKRSTLRDGRVFCTECLETLRGLTAAPDVPAPTLAQPAPIEVPPYLAVDSSGIEYTIPARDRRSACEAGIHPVKALGPVIADPTIGPARACSACSLVVPIVQIGADEIEQARSDVERLGRMSAPAQSAVALLDPAPEPVAPVAPAVAVTAVTDRPEGPPDVFADPAAHIEVKRDRWGRYVLPDPVTGEEKGWTRASTLARAMSDEYNLTRWKMRTAARGTALSRDLIAGFVAADPDDKATLNKLTESAMERAESSSGATFGTALHNFTHRLDRGESLESLRAPDPLGADLVEYQATLARHGLGIVPGLIERIVICPAVGAAGTFDRFVQQRPGPGSNCPLSVLDLKTAKSIDWSWLEIAVQLGIYGNASHMWDPVTGTYTELPPRDVLDRDRALVLHLPVGQATGNLYGVNIIEGWEAAQVAETVRRYRNGSKGYGWLVNPVDPEALLIHRVSQAADGSELARLWDRHYPRGEWTSAVANAAELRAARLGAVPA